MTKLAAIILALTVSAPAWADSRTVVLSVPGMTCAVCPITVKKAVSKVDGVSKIEVNLGKLEVMVTYDDAKTNIQALTKATENAGYPSTVK